MTLDEVWKQVRTVGPSHVMLDKEGTTMMREIAVKKNPDLSWDVIYIRDDGYSLGCEFYLSQFAEHLQRDRWIAVMMRGAPKLKMVNFAVDIPTVSVL